MHGLINRAIQRFLSDTFGAETWAEVARRAGVGPEGFEPMALYDRQVTDAVLAAASEVLGRPAAGLLEDLGTYLVSCPGRPALRRLLRFGGASFSDFLLSLDEIPGRARLALPELALPPLEIEDHDPGRVVIVCRGGPAGFAPVAAGLLRAMADDYGALVVIETEEVAGELAGHGAGEVSAEAAAGGAREVAGEVSAEAAAGGARGVAGEVAGEVAAVVAGDVGGAVAGAAARAVAGAVAATAGGARLVVRLLDPGFSDARPFALVAGAG